VLSLNSLICAISDCVYFSSYFHSFRKTTCCDKVRSLSIKDLLIVALLDCIVKIRSLMGLKITGLVSLSPSEDWPNMDVSMLHLL
jgi:hypothetical protein